MAIVLECLLLVRLMIDRISGSFVALCTLWVFCDFIEGGIKFLSQIQDRVKKI